MISQPPYVWYHIQYMWDILSTTLTTSYPLCKTTQPFVLFTPHLAYVCHHLRYRRCHIYSITPRHNLYDFISSSGMTSHHLYQTSHQLYLCHHNLSTAITPTFVWHHTHYMCDIICINITSYPLLMSLHYCTYDSITLTYETTSTMQFKIYTIHVTSQSLVCVITPTVLSASQPLFVWHYTRHMYNIFPTIEDITCSLYEIKPPFLWHHTHYIWHCINAISVTSSTVLMISHQLYLWDLIMYICQHHMHCIQQHIHYICTITATVPVFHMHSFHDITPFVHMTLHPLYV